MLLTAAKAGTALMLASIVALLAYTKQPATPQLIDQTGRVVTMHSFDGRPLVVTFVAATCTDACPLINAEFAAVQRELMERRLDARLLTISLEPERDTPAVMRALAKKFDADPRYWLFCTGHPADVHRIMEAFGARGGDEHTTFVYVFDRHGLLRDRMLASNVLDRQITGDAKLYGTVAP